MHARRLTERLLRTIKTNGLRLEIRDQQICGLELRVTSQSTKTWLLRYRRKSDGKKRALTLGRFPEMTLKEARVRAVEERAQIGRGADPASRVSTRTAMTFFELAEKRLSEDSTIGEGSKRNYRHCFTSDVYSAIGAIPAASVSGDQVARILDAIEKRGSPVQADRTRAAIGSTFKWAVKRRLANVLSDPTTGLGKRASSMPRMRVLTPDELGRLWRSINSDIAPLTSAMRLIFQIAFLTGQRRTEVAGAKIKELALEGSLPAWTIPGEGGRGKNRTPGRTKNRRGQNLPLSKHAAELFRHAIHHSEGAEYVFPADIIHVKAGNKPRMPHIHGESVSRAMRRLRASTGIEDITIHDLRKCMSTWLGEQGTRPDVIDRILNHQPRDVTRRHYNFAQMDGLVRQALQSWANHVCTLGETQR